jgi:N-acetylglutamate synthase-like GNAT family acetyltransferase
MIEIAQYSQGHQEGVVSVILPVQQEEFGIPVTLADQPDLLDIPNFYQRGVGNFWVAILNAEVVGTIALLDIGNSQSALRKVFVKEPFRGGAHGVARRLLDELLRWCTERSVSEVYLGTTAKFLAAHRFYEKNGFKEIAKPLLPPAFPIMAVDTKFYSHQLPRGLPNKPLVPTHKSEALLLAAQRRR